MTTQIAGPVQGNKALFLVRYKLLKAAIAVASPSTTGFVLFNGRHFTFNPQQWSKYEVDLHHFLSIKDSDFHVVCNEIATRPGFIDYETALSILAAMLYRKPIVLTHTPSFSTTVDYFTRELITANVSRMQLLALPTFSSREIKDLLDALPKRIDYQLNAHQQALIASKLKEHFRDLLQPVTTPRIYRQARIVRRIAPRLA